MGVYQSVTAPDVQRRGFEQVFPRYAVDTLGTRYVISRLRKVNKIPRKVTPEIEDTPSGVRFRFRWFQVETFN